MAERSQRPRPDREGISLLDADAIDYPPSKQKPDAIRKDEAVNDVAIAPVVERDILIATQDVFQHGLNQAQCGPVHIVDGRSQKEQAAYHPAQIRSISG